MDVSELLLGLRQALGGSFDPDAERLTLEDGAGRLVAERGEAHALRIAIEFSEPLRVELSVRKLREEDYWDFWTDPEITFDDPEFDDTLLVRGKGGVEVVLDREVRALLVNLAKAAEELTLNRHGLAIDLALADAGAIERAWDLLAAARRLVGAADVRASPYR